MSDPLSKVTTALATAGIIPTVVPTSFTPAMLFSVVWPGTGAEVVLGEQLVRDLTLDEPEIRVLPMSGASASVWAQQESDDDETPPRTYTLVMTDPDAPSRADPKYGQWRHWVVPGLELPASSTTAQGNAFALKPKAATTAYYPPGPPPGSGLHRYIFLLFEDPKGGLNIPVDAPEHQNEFTSRRNWNAMAFADKYGLKLVGVNYFLTQAMEPSE